MFTLLHKWDRQGASKRFQRIYNAYRDSYFHFILNYNDNQKNIALIGKSLNRILFSLKEQWA